MAGLYSIIEGATGHRDALIWPSLGKSREAFTAMLVAANAYYLSLASASAEEARRNTETIEKTIPVMSDLADNDLQRMALTRLHARTAGAAGGVGETDRAARQPHRIAAQHHRRQPGRRDRRHRRILGQDAPARAEGAGNLRPHAVGHFAPGAVDRRDLPRHHPVRRRPDRALDPAAAAADHGGDARDHLGQLRSQRAGHHRQGRGRRDGARGGSVPRERHRQAQDRGRAARLEGKGRERAARTQHRAAEPDRRRTAGGARRPGRRRRP